MCDEREQERPTTEEDNEELLMECTGLIQTEDVFQKMRKRELMIAKMMSNYAALEKEGKIEEREIILYVMNSVS